MGTFLMWFQGDTFNVVHRVGLNLVGLNPRLGVAPMVGVTQAQVTTTTLSCCTNAELGERAVCSSGLRCRHRSPSPMEYVRDEGG